jgi:transcriptional regulator of met regulon
VNGYASYFPEDYDLTRERLNALPSNAALAELRRLGVDYVIVHPDDYAEDGKDGEAVVKAADNNPSLKRITGGDGGAILYRVER